MPTDLTTLSRMLDEATGPSRELDAQIHMAPQVIERLGSIRQGVGGTGEGADG